MLRAFFSCVLPDADEYPACACRLLLHRHLQPARGRSRSESPCSRCCASSWPSRLCRQFRPPRACTGPLGGQYGTVRMFSCVSPQGLARLAMRCCLNAPAGVSPHKGYHVECCSAKCIRRQRRLTPTMAAAQLALGLTAFLLIWQIILLAVAARALHVLNNDFRCESHRLRVML